MDFLHCALIAILVLLAIYCSRSFREGNDGNGQVPFYLSVVNPAYPHECAQAKVTASTKEGKANAKKLWDATRSGVGSSLLESWGMMTRACGERGHPPYDNPGTSTSDMFDYRPFFNILENDFPGVNIKADGNLFTNLSNVLGD